MSGTVVSIEDTEMYKRVAALKDTLGNDLLLVAIPP